MTVFSGALFVVNGDSMAPTFETGQYLVINRLTYRNSTPQRGDVIVFRLPDGQTADLIKRVIGLPGETIEFRATEVYINGQRLLEPYVKEPCQLSFCGNRIWQLGEDDYFVMGDNRNQSTDSRFFGAIHIDNILGEAFFRYYPFSELNWLHQIGID